MSQCNDDNGEIVELRFSSDNMTAIRRAAALANIDLVDYLQTRILLAAHETIRVSKRIVLSERDSLRLLDLLDNPPEPTSQLLQAARDLPHDVI